MRLYSRIRVYISNLGSALVKKKKRNPELLNLSLLSKVRGEATPKL